MIHQSDCSQVDQQGCCCRRRCFERLSWYYDVSPRSSLRLGQKDRTDAVAVGSEACCYCSIAHSSPCSTTPSQPIAFHSHCLCWSKESSYPEPALSALCFLPGGVAIQAPGAFHLVVVSILRTWCLEWPLGLSWCAAGSWDCRCWLGRDLPRRHSRADLDKVVLSGTLG